MREQMVTTMPHHTQMFVQEYDFCEVATVPDSKVPEVNTGTRRRWLHSLTEVGRSWLGGLNGLEDAKALVTNGWQEGAERALELKREIEDLSPRPVSVRRRLRWRAEGDELSHERLYAGQLDQMWRVGARESQRSPRILSILGHFGGTADRTDEEMFWSGAAMLAMSDVLENAGYSTELKAVNYSRNFEMAAGAGLVTIVRLKEAGEPLRADVVAVCASHSGFFRTFGLLMKERAPFSVAGGHGQTADFAPIVPDLVDAGAMDRADVVIGQVSNRAEAVAELRRAVERINAGMMA